jgi:phosphoribosyl 1,2-cyclic phosphate phosphodiesterase
MFQCEKLMKNYLWILGSGSAQMTPCHGCNCISCIEARKNPRFMRDCSTYLFNFDGIHILIDYGSQLLNKYGLSLLIIDYIFISHSHSDHFKGLFPMIWTQQEKITIYYSGKDLSGAFKDILESPKHCNFIKCDVFEQIEINNSLKITPILLNHNVYTTGFYINYKNYSIGYLLDTKGLPDETLQYLKDKNQIDLLLIDANYGPRRESDNHNNFDDALETINGLKPKNAILTHISHNNPSIKWLKNYVKEKIKLEKTVKNTFIAYDGMKFKFEI